jgi:aspartate/methionine/tyrosine aminotransferase
MPSKLVEQLSPFYVMEVLEFAKKLESEGRDIIHFEVGEPDFITPGEICESAIESIKRGETKYTESVGIPELREKIAENYNIKYGQSISFSNVMVTLGSSPALFLTILSTINPGDEVIITDPHYACYPQIINIAGGVPKKVRITEENGFQIDVAEIKKNITNKTKAIIINSPSNPTGAILETEVFREIADLGICIISDEIYHGIEYSRKANSVYEFTDNAFVINGFSKLYAMTGWRLGYIIAPEVFIRPLQKLQQNLFISPNSFVQKAGITAIDKAKQKTDDMVKEFHQRRDLMLGGLRDTGFKIKKDPDGAFYIFLNISDYASNSYDLSFDILNKVNVAVTPGIDFGEGGEEYIRLSYATSRELIKEGVKRLSDYFKQI